MKRQPEFHSLMFVAILLALIPCLGRAFTTIARTTVPTHPSPLCLNALSERQLQFWEDVEEGLDDIESFYNKSNQSIDRIRQFCQTAQGQLPPPPHTKEHQPSEEHVPGLTARPFWDTTANPDLFPWASALEEQSSVIMDEYLSKLQTSKQFASDSVWQNQVMGSGWSAIRLQRLGVWNTENCQEFPETYRLLKSLKIPLAVRGVCFAKQSPRSGVQPHSDGRNFILTSHLGLSIPDDCWMQVGHERRGWEKGKLTTLDTSFTHSTGNPSDRDRHVLILDFWHPELTGAEIAALEFVYDLRNQFESGKVPYRTPRSLQQRKEDQGLAGWWNKLTSAQES